MKTFAICLLLALCLSACGNRGDLVLPSPGMIDPSPSVAPVGAADDPDAALPEPPPELPDELPDDAPDDDDGNG